MCQAWILKKNLVLLFQSFCFIFLISLEREKLKIEIKITLFLNVDTMFLFHWRVNALNFCINRKKSWCIFPWIKYFARYFQFILSFKFSLKLFHCNSLSYRNMLCIELFIVRYPWRKGKVPLYNLIINWLENWFGGKDWKYRLKVTLCRFAGSWFTEIRTSPHIEATIWSSTIRRGAVTVDYVIP